MEKTESCSVFLDLPDREEAVALGSALGEAGVRAVIAPPHISAPVDGIEAIQAGEILDSIVRAEGIDFIFVDGDHWLAIRDILPLPPRSYWVVVLISPQRESQAASILGEGAFDYLVRGGRDFPIAAASYFRALGALKKRFSGAYGVLERRYEDLVHALPDIIYELDGEGRFTFINNSIRLLGYDPADLVGLHFSVLLHADDVPAVDRETVLDLFRGTRTGPALSPKLFNERRAFDRRTENLEVRLRRKPGSRTDEGDMIATVIAYGEVTAAGGYKRDGTPFSGTVGVIRDITLRRKSEDMLRKLYQAVDQFTAGVLVADRAFVVEYVNPAFLRISGLGPQQVIGRELSAFFDLPAAKAEDMRTLVRDGFDVREQARLAGNGEELGPWTALHASPVRSPSGDVSNAIVICEDVSQRKAMEELVTLAKEEAERANRAKSDFLSSMSHELKSPVANVLAAARLIEMGGPEPGRQARSIIESAEGLLDMLGDILDFVRFETGAGTIRKTVFLLPGFVQRVCEKARRRAEAKGLTFEIGQLPDGPVSTDPDRLGRAFAAILDNAVSFTPTGGIRVDAVLERRSGNVNHLVLTAADTGVGIPAEDQGRIFLPFVQLASPYTKSGGAGIGLSLARNIVRALGGEIRLQSDPGRGSLFTVLLPVEEPQRRAAREEPARRVYRILVVDDNEVNLEYMSTILANIGHRIDVAVNGADALRVLEERPPDAAILDIQMPGMSGIELGRKVRAYAGNRYDPGMPLVALTAFAPEEVLDSSVDFDAVFSKPVDVPKLLAALDEAVDRREAVERLPPLVIPPGARGEEAASLSKTYAEMPRLVAEIRERAEAGDAEGFRDAARALGGHFSRLGFERPAAALRRLVLAVAEEDREVARNRADRFATAWKRYERSLGEANGS